MQTVFEILRTFGLALFSVFVAAVVARRWQHRNWLQQQRIADIEKSYQELKTLFNDFVRVGGRRLYRSRRLLDALKVGNLTTVEDRLKDYDEVLAEWNEQYQNFYVRFVQTLTRGAQLHDQIDTGIRNRFVRAGKLLERGVRRCRNGHAAALTKDEIATIESCHVRAGRQLLLASQAIFADLQARSSSRLDGEFLARDALRRGKYQELSSLEILGEILRPARR